MIIGPDTEEEVGMATSAKRTITLGIAVALSLAGCSAGTHGDPSPKGHPAATSAARFHDPRQVRTALVAGGFECKTASGERTPQPDMNGALRLDCWHRGQDVALFTYANPTQQRLDRTSQVRMGAPLGHRLGGTGWDVYTPLPDVLRSVDQALR